MIGHATELRSDKIRAESACQYTGVRTRKRARQIVIRRDSRTQKSEQIVGVEVEGMIRDRKLGLTASARHKCIL
jgi:hypothetical protein